jgi:hypothetical protein
LTPVAPYKPAPAMAPAKGPLPTILSTKLPFTGIALWFVLLIAAGLMAAGAAARRLSPRTR